MKPLHVVRQIGISHGSITKWKQGAAPSGASLQKIADYFDVSVDYLLGKEKKELPLGRIIERVEEIELLKKINTLDAADRIKAEAFIDGLLAADKYQEPTYQIKIAARGGGVKKITVTDSQLQAIKNLPEVTDLGSSDNLK